MAYLPKFENDLFVSYGHIDDSPLGEGKRGSVSRFHTDLQRRVNQYLGTEVKIWRDNSLSGNTEFPEEIERNLKGAAAWIPVLSPRFLSSSWCQHEQGIFLNAVEATCGLKVGTRSRIFKVVTTLVELRALPETMQQVLGYEFGRYDDVSKSVQGGSVNSVAFSPDSRQVATGSKDQSVQLIEAATGKNVWSFQAEGPVARLAFSPHGRLVAAVDGDRTGFIRILEASTGTSKISAMLSDAVSTVAFSPDESYIAIGSWDTTARLYRLDNGIEVWRKPHDREVRSIAFSGEDTILQQGVQMGQRGYSRPRRAVRVRSPRRCELKGDCQSAERNWKLPVQF